MTIPTFRRRLLAAVILAAITSSVAAPAFAQQDEETRRPPRKSHDVKPAPAPSKYPAATRSVPAGKASMKGTPKLQAMLKSFNEGKTADARAAADAIIGGADFNPYEKAFAAQIAAQVAIQAQDFASALRYIDVAIAQDSLDNDTHYGLMQQRAQIQVMTKDYAGALTSIDRFLAETHATDPVPLVTRANALYRLGRYAEAAAVLKPIVAASPGHSDWQALLADALARSGNAGEATKMAEALVAKNPGDKQARFNLVQSYLQTKQTDKAAQLLEDMRKSGQLTEDTDYRQLFSIYANMRGKEQQTIDIINEGMSKGALKPDFAVYLALAQSYYFSHQTAKAIDAYRKAAPLAADGEVYLALAGVLRNEQRIPEAKAAAEQALAKGIKHPEAAKKIIALPGK